MLRNLFCLTPLIFVGMALSAWSAEPPPADIYGIRSEPLDRTYGALRALVIGVGYKENDNHANLKLPNAENDAAEVAAALQKLYGFQVNSLIGPNATKAKIDRELDALSAMTRDDCVLVFFAGHCQLGEGNAAGVLLANDVSFTGGKLHTNYLRIEEDVITKLKKCPARHTLLILDACHSGTIFQVLSGLPPSKIDDRKSDQLFKQAAFQGIASAMTFQTASDGAGAHSPFCAALLKGLRHLPAKQLLYRRERFPEPIPVTELFRFISPELAVLPDGQRPDLRTLVGEGEFTFFPRKDQEEYFASQSPHLDERLVLQATMTSERGDWWFQEMPWFIPGLRQKILANIGPTRNSRPTALIDRDSLKRLTETFLTDNSDRASLDDLFREANLLPLTTEKAPAPDAARQPDAPAFREALRKRHARRLLDAETKSRFTEELAEIIAELELARTELRKYQADLEAPDLHLAAVLKHALARDLKSKQAAVAAYEDALRMYQAGQSPETVPSLKNVALLAICKSDYAYFLAQALGDYGQASKQYHDSDSIFGNAAPPPFRISILCRSADAKLAQNRFLEADKFLEEAKRVADGFTKDHPINANVHRTTAWARMIQWRIKDAETEFELSKAILAKVLRQEKQATRPAAAADQSPRLPSAGTAHGICDQEMRDILLASNNYQAKVAYFHNQHGLAMVRRFLGDAESAAADYRELAALIEDAISAMRDAEGDIPADTEHWLFDRLVNTLERLGDCNLFGDPAVRDLREAADDYRRALNLVNRIQRNNRDRTRTQLLYKQALAICLVDQGSVPDRGDAAMALQMCAEADQLFAGMKTRSGLLGSLGSLVPKVVQLIDAATASSTVPHQAAANSLRQAILEFRDAEGPYLHRDQIEMCLLSTKVLLELGHDDVAFHRQQDRALLLGFCRQALTPSRGKSETGEYNNDNRDTRKYLRPYYDAAMRLGIQEHPVPVKDLLEVQAEATTGQRYMKPSKATATLAIYDLDGHIVFLLDLPRGPGICVQGSVDSEPDDGSEDLETQRRLPSRIEELLIAWRGAGSKEIQEIDCRWQDPAFSHFAALPIPEQTAGDQDSSPTGVLPTIRVRPFPFKLPRGFRENSVPLRP